ncbi:MAG: GTPase Era [Alphaproteobacteria bacterium]|nr:GTPase Era [Alphaproteobacteria bacterium]
MRRCGFVSILGLPNAGKSTLVNALVGSKVSIVSKKAQTTRCRVLGIALKDEAQIILMDTPGIFSPSRPMDRAMVGAAWDTLDQADAVIHLVDASRKNAVSINADIIEKLPKDKPCLLVLNKTDQTDKSVLLKYAQGFSEKYNYAATFMISALKNDHVSDVLDALAGHMPEEEWRFAEDEITDLPMRFMAAEITREKIFQQLHEELPYAALVDTETWEEFGNGSVKIGQIVYVKKDSQKAIVLGKGGSRIKEIGEKARLDMEKIFGRRVHLKLFVKLQENWDTKMENLRIMGLDTQ